MPTSSASCMPYWAPRIRPQSHAEDPQWPEVPPPQIRPLAHAEAMHPYQWKQVEIKTADFHRCPAYVAPQSDADFGRWELKTFHAHLYTMKLHKWMKTGRLSGGERVLQVGHKVAAGLHCQWYPPARALQSKRSNQATAHGAATTHGAATELTAAGAQPALFGYVVSTPYLLLYMLVACPASTSTTPGKSRRSQMALSLLQHMLTRATVAPISCDFPKLGKCTISGGYMTCSDADLQHMLQAAVGCASGSAVEISQCLRVCQQAVCQGIDGFDMAIAKEVCGTLMCHLSACVDAWASALPPACAHVMLHTHLRGKKRALHGNPGLRCVLAKKRRMNTTTQEWADDSAAGHGAVDANKTLDKVCCHHYNLVRRTISPQTVVELCMDASRFATRDTEVVVCFSSEAAWQTSWFPGNPSKPDAVGVAAFLPPLSLPELSWRIGIAGSKISAEEKQDFEKRGFQQRDGMPTRNYLQLINQSLGHIGKSLVTFEAPALSLMPTGGVRYWSAKQHRWMRAPQASPRGDMPDEPELPDNMLEMSTWAAMPLLHLTVDQASTGWSACHFLSWPRLGIRSPDQATNRRRRIPRSPGGMNLMLHFLMDPFHRSWNDFKWACKHALGHMNSSIMQMMVVYNHNYQPYLNGANLGKKTEFLLDFQQLFPHHGHEWEEVLSNLGSIATAENGVEFGGGAASTQEAAALYKLLVLQCKSFQDTVVHTLSPCLHSMSQPWCRGQHDQHIACRFPGKPTTWGMSVWRFHAVHGAHSGPGMITGSKSCSVCPGEGNVCQKLVMACDHCSRPPL